MADPSGVQAALAVEAVEWESAEGGKLTIRVRGRWRRRRPEWRGQPVLAIEAEGNRHRFPATPEPPSLTGAPPGSWQMTFSVPAWLAPYLGGRIWLQLGLAVIPLPAPVGGEAGPPERTAVDPEVLTDRRIHTAELMAERWRAEHAEAEALASELTIRVQELEQKLEQARQEPERLRKLIADRDQQRRAAEQRAHAERALRVELEEALDAGARDARARARIEAGELATAEARVRELEDELEELRAQLAAAAGEAVPPPLRAEIPFELRAEVAVAAKRWPVTTPAAVVLAAAEAEYRALAAERRLLAPTRSPAAGPEPAGSGAEELELTTVLLELRSELRRLAQIAERERTGRFEAEQRVAELERRVAELERSLRERELRSARAYDAVHELRRLLDSARAASAGARGAEVAPERFDEALSRLRATARQPPDEGGAEPQAPTPGPEAAGFPSAGPWLDPVFRRLTAADPERAGRLLVGLLPAQGAVYSEPIAYDLVLGDDVCVQLTLSSGGAAPEIVIASAPRDLESLTFRVAGDHAGLARLLTAGRLRVRLGVGVAKVTGDRDGLVALRALVRSPRSLDDLYEAGVRLDPELAFTLAAAMVRPEWTHEQRFTIAHHSSTRPGQATYLNVRDGEPLTVTDAPPDGPAATIVCRDDELLAVLAGEPRGEASVHGDAARLLALLGWLARAQHE